jgi:hypothetical protein
MLHKKIASRRATAVAAASTAAAGFPLGESTTLSFIWPLAFDGKNKLVA